MALFPNIWRPGPGRLGVRSVVVSAEVGTGGITIANSTTTAVPVATPRRRAFIEGVSLVGTVAAASTGAVTVQLKKYKLSTTSDVTITAATSVKSDVITGSNVSAALTISATTAQRVVEVGDILRLDCVAAGTVSTQPTACVVVELGLIS